MKKLSPVRLLALGFAVLIFCGACALALPWASRDGASLPFGDALFTSVSASCVTGLVVRDTWTQFSLFGQVVILCLIQVGGLGFMALAVLVSLLTRKRIGLKSRSRLVEAEGALQLGGVVKLTRLILRGTALCEGIGALLLAIRFVPRFGLWRGGWFSIFHAVSAFCNAGFDLLGILEPYGSLCAFSDDALVLCVLMALIVVGGVGFLVWEDLAEHRLHARRWRLHTKLALCAAGALIVSGMALFLVTERRGVLAGLPLGEKLLTAFVLSVSPRTAGFNSVDLSALSAGGMALTLLLMAVGASPGSTGGGMKTTTLVVVLLSVFASARGKEDCELFGRRVDDGTVRRAFRSAVLYGLVACLGCLMLVILQPLPLGEAVFEGLSALGTVGLSLGTTRSLSGASRVVVMLMMYAGRVGSLSVMTAVALRRQPAALRRPQEKVLVG